MGNTFGYKHQAGQVSGNEEGRMQKEEKGAPNKRLANVKCCVLNFCAKGERAGLIVPQKIYGIRLFYCFEKKD
jgi:hypothetical protein